jgi:hypothetical protein
MRPSRSAATTRAGAARARSSRSATGHSPGRKTRANRWVPERRQSDLSMVCPRALRRRLPENVTPPGVGSACCSTRSHPASRSTSCHLTPSSSPRGTPDRQISTPLLGRSTWRRPELIAGTVTRTVEWSVGFTGVDRLSTLAARSDRDTLGGVTSTECTRERLVSARLPAWRRPSCPPKRYPRVARLGTR